MIWIPIVFLSLYVFLILLYRDGWKRQELSICPDDFIPKTGITVVIPARNEENNIGQCLNSILKNNFPGKLLEIIVVDDFSTDNTFEIARNTLKDVGLVLQLKNVVFETANSFAYKKRALETGILHAKFALIVTTDADCILPEDWLKNIAYLEQEKQAQFIAAPVSFFKRNESNLLYYFQSLDFLMMQGITVASINKKMGNMCNGANLAFKKSAFNEVEGYKNIDHVASGDDLLLMEKINKVYPEHVFYLKSKEAIALTEIQPTWKDFLNQRIRWASKNDQYESKKLIASLLLVYLFNLSLLVLFFLAFFNFYYFKVLLLLLAIKIIVEMIFLIPVARFYGKIKELIYFPFLQPLHILYIVAAGFFGKVGKYSWKDRKVS